MLPTDLLVTAMRLAIEEARVAYADGNSPFGAVLVGPRGEVVTSAHNTQRSDLRPAGHAEINLLSRAAQLLKTITFDGYTIVANAEPCSGCASFAIKQGIRTFAYGTSAEPSMEPWIPLVEVVAATRSGPVEITSGVLLNDCREVLEAGRAANASRTTRASGAKDR